MKLQRLIRAQSLLVGAVGFLVVEIQLFSVVFEMYYQELRVALCSWRSGAIQMPVITIIWVGERSTLHGEEGCELPFGAT